MSIDTVMLLMSNSALQGFMEAWGNARAKGGEEFLAVNENQYNAHHGTGVVLSFAGRMISVAPYLGSPAIMQLFTQSIVNPHYVGIGLALLNCIPLAVLVENSENSELSLRIGKMLGVAMQIMNLLVIGALIATAATPMSLSSIVAATLCATPSAISIAFTTFGSRQVEAE